MLAFIIFSLKCATFSCLPYERVCMFVCCVPHIFVMRLNSELFGAIRGNRCGKGSPFMSEVRRS